MVIENELAIDTQEQAEAQLPTCCHHWIIQPAVGPVSEGACRKCGEVKEFKNSIDYETEWTNRRELARSELGAPDHLDEADEMAG